MRTKQVLCLISTGTESEKLVQLFLCRDTLASTDTYLFTVCVSTKGIPMHTWSQIIWFFAFLILRDRKSNR